MEVEVKKNKIERKYIFIGLVLLILVILFGVTVSYFRSDFVSQNEILATGNSVTVSDTFNGPTNWVPGDSINTNFTISNPSSVPVVLRASISETWNNSDLNNQINGEDVVLKEIGSDWTYYDGYYYYNNTLANHSSTSTTLFSKLTFNPNVEAEVNCTTNDGVRECSSDGTYTKAKYKLTITYEFISTESSTWNYNIVNPHIKGAWVYNEEKSDSNYCQTGNEDTCQETTCIYDSSTCPPVNKSTIL